jgi:hypothetical protein
VEGDDDAPEGAQRAEGVDGDVPADGVAEALQVGGLEDGGVVEILLRELVCAFDEDGEAMLTVMRRVLDGGEGVIRGGTLVRSRDRFSLFLDDRRLDVGDWSGVNDEADDEAVISAVSDGGMGVVCGWCRCRRTEAVIWRR